MNVNNELFDRPTRDLYNLMSASLSFFVRRYEKQIPVFVLCRVKRVLDNEFIFYAFIHLWESVD